MGDWRRGNKDGKVNGTSLYTIFPEAKLQFAFTGTSFSIVGTRDKGYGIFDVYVDGRFSKSVSLHSNSRQANEPLHIETDLQEGDHFVTILTKSSLPVEIQYIALTGQAKPIEVNDWYYFLAVGLPLIIILAVALTTISVLYYLKSKNKKIEFFKKFKSKFKQKNNEVLKEDDNTKKDISITGEETVKKSNKNNKASQANSSNRKKNKSKGK